MRANGSAPQYYGSGRRPRWRANLLDNVRALRSIILQMAILPVASDGVTLPYMPFSRFRESLDAIALSLPSRFDRNTWAGESPYTATLLLKTYAFLGLTDAHRSPSDRLRRLANDPENRTATLQEVLRAAYGDLLRIVADAKSPADLDRALSGSRISGATHRKSVSFLLNACAYARLPISPALSGKLRASHFKPSPATDQSDETTNITVPLRSGGTITLSGSFNPFRLSAADRHFVFRLVDQLQAYQHDQRAAEPISPDLEEEEAPF